MQSTEPEHKAQRLGSVMKSLDPAGAVTKSGRVFGTNISNLPAPFDHGEDKKVVKVVAYHSRYPPHGREHESLQRAESGPGPGLGREARSEAEAGAIPGVGLIAGTGTGTRTGVREGKGAGHLNDSFYEVDEEPKARKPFGMVLSKESFGVPLQTVQPVKRSPTCQECAEYAKEIDEYLYELESYHELQSGYMVRQVDLNDKMRAILIDWLVEVHLRFKLVPETLYLTVNLIDRYLERVVTMRKHLQLVGVTAMLLACKYEEIYAPEVKDFVYITDNAYTREDILAMEQKMLRELAFELGTPSSYCFLQRFIALQNSSPRVQAMAQYMLELSLLEASMIQYPPSQISAAALCLAGRVVAKERHWDSAMADKTRYLEQDLKPAMKQLLTLVQIAPKSSFQAVRSKFALQKYFAVSQAPAHRPTS